jgi:hypothetical protein
MMPNREWSLLAANERQIVESLIEKARREGGIHRVQIDGAELYAYQGAKGIHWGRDRGVNDARGVVE